MESRCQGEVTFVRANVDESRYENLARKYRVNAIPQYVLLDPSGNIERQWVGTTSEADFNSALGKICK
jgi:thioredoxin-related protein